jgi:hypothetical protein
MTKYKCNICDKIFPVKTDYTRHINRKFSCNIDNKYINLTVNNIKTEITNNLISSNKTLNNLVDDLEEKKYEKKIKFLDNKKYTLNIDDIMGIDAFIAYEFFKKDKNIISCIYFFTLGTVKELRNVMNIDNKYADGDIVGKYGFTKNLTMRLYQHINGIGKIKNCNLKLKFYSSIDPIFISKAENKIKACVDSLNSKITYEKTEEIIVIKTNILSYFEEQYNMIGIKYKYNVSEIINELKENDDKKDIKIRKLENENEKLVYENIILKKDLELQKEKYENVLLLKEIEIMKIQQNIKN